jgi:hypothetical protein
MHWLLIGAALISVGVGLTAATLRLVIDLLRVVDEKSQAPPSDSTSYAPAAENTFDGLGYTMRSGSMCKGVNDGQEF